MKRLFFLFVFIFIGFGAFGQMDNLQLDKNIYGSLLTDTIPPSFGKEKKLPQGDYMLYSLKFYTTTLQDDIASPFLYSGYGGGFNLAFEHLGKLYLYGGIGMDILSLRPANRHQREFLENLNFLNNPNYLRMRFGPLIAGHSIKNSPHYLGLSFEGEFQSISYRIFHGYFDSTVPPSNSRAYLGLSYMYFGKVRKIPFDINVNFPVIITPVVVKTPYRNFTDYFNPTLKIDFMPFRSYGNIELSYACEYLNYHRNRDIRHRYRQIINSFSIKLRYRA